MSKSLKILFSTVLLLSSCLFGQQMIDGIAAIVGEDIILYSEVNQMAFEMAQQNNVDIYENQDQFIKIQEDALKELVQSKIILLQAAVDSIEVSEREVSSSVEQQIQQYITMAGSEETLEMYLDTPIKKIREQLFDRIKSQMVVQQLQSEKFSKIKISRPEVIDYYRSNKGDLPDLPNRIDISHILIEEKPSPVSKKKTLDHINSIRGNILNGKINFEDAAKQYSQDPGSAPDGGDLGFSPKGTFVPPFEKAAYSLDINEISPAVETQFGYHIIQLLEKRGDMIHTRHILIPIQTTEDDDNYVINMLSTIRDSIILTDDFERFALKYSDDPDVGANKGYLGEFDAENMQIPEFSDAAKNMEAGDISSVFVSQYGFHIILLNNKKASEPISLKTHYATLESMALNEKKQAFWDNWMDQLYSKFYVEIKY